MRARFLLFLIFVLTVAFVPVRVSAAVESFNFKGPTADAYFYSVDGCLEDSAFITASDGHIKESGSKSELVSQVFVSIFRYNHCDTPEVLINAVGSVTLSVEAFQLDNKLTSATLNTTVVEVCDVDTGEECFPVSVALTWTGTGEISKGKSKFSYTTGGCKTQSDSKGTYRSAVASGSVTALEIEFASQPSGSAYLSNLQSGFTSINCE